MVAGPDTKGGRLLNFVSDMRDWAKSPSVATLALFAGGNFAAAILNGIGGLVQVCWVSPEVFGEFRKYGILTAYFAIGTAFVHDGLCRQVPYYLGRGDEARALKIAGVAKLWYLFATGVVSAVFLVLAGISAASGDWSGVVGWAAQVAVAAGTVYGMFLTVMYRTSSDFRRLSYNTVCSTVVSCFLLVTVRLWGFVGLAIRLVGTNVFALWMNRRHLPVQVGLVLDWAELKSLMAMSLRFSIPGYLDTSAFAATLNAALLFSCGERGVGLFAFALALRTFLQTFNDSLAQIFQTKVGLRYGETGDFGSCLRYAMRPAVLAFGASAVLCVGAILVLDPIVRIFLPKYVDAIPVANVLFLGIVTSALCLPLTLTRAAEMYAAVYAQCAGQVLTALLLLWLMPHDPVSMAWIQVLSGLGNCVGGYLFVVRRLLSEGGLMSCR